MITIKVTDDGYPVETYTIAVDADNGSVILTRNTGGVINFKLDRDAAKSHLLNQLRSDLNAAIGFSVHRTTVAVGHPPTADDKVLYWGTCSCGWVGDKWGSRDLAQASANGHFVFPELVVKS